MGTMIVYALELYIIVFRRGPSFPFDPVYLCIARLVINLRSTSERISDKAISEEAKLSVDPANFVLVAKNTQPCAKLRRHLFDPENCYQTSSQRYADSRFSDHLSNNYLVLRILGGFGWCVPLG